MENLEITPEVLNFLAKKARMTIDDVRSEVENMKRQELLDMHPYEIWQGSNGNWYTYLPDVTKRNGRRQIKRSTQKKLEDAVIKDVTLRIEKENNLNLTFEELYPEWLEYKDLVSASDSYAAKLQYDYERYWKDTDIIKMPIKKLDELKLEVFLLKVVEEKQMTKRHYSDMKSVLNMLYDYAILKKIVTVNVSRNVVVKKNKFTDPPKRKNYEEVFLTNEQEAIVLEVMNDYHKRPDFTTPLAIPLGFKIGDRVGELVSLKGSDIEGNYLHIQRQEIACYCDVDGKRKKNGWKVVEYTKSEAGDRRVYLTPSTREIINLLIQTNIRNGYDPNGYLFMNNGDKIHARAVDSQIRKYCRHIGIKGKSNHKIRKTFGSTLVDSKMSIDKVMEFMGHKDKRTLLNNYCFNRYTDKQTEEQMENALCG